MLLEGDFKYNTCLVGARPAADLCLTSPGKAEGMTTTPAQRRFPSPFEVEAPPGAEEWRRLYPYYYLFSDERREFEEEKFWFFDGMHNPEPVYPFDPIIPES